MSNTKMLAFAALLSLAGSLPGSVALAQVGTPAVAPPISAGKAGMTPEAKKAKSAECSKQADAKGLHGDARRKFRSECKKG
jgi:hypothetical protein